MKTKTPKVIWTSEEKSKLVKRLVILREEFPIVHLRDLITKAQEQAFEPHRRRNIGTTLAVPEIVRLFEDAWIDYIFTTEIITIEKVVEPTKPFITEFTIEQLTAELGTRMSNMQRDMGMLLEEHAKRSHPTLHVQAALMETFPDKFPDPPKQPKIRIGMLSFLTGQIHHLRQKLVNHTDRFEFVLRGSDEKSSHRGFGGTMDAIICFKNMRHHSTDRLFEHLKGKIPLGRATGLEDAARMVTNLCVGKPIDAD